jgi:hypothetical protein
MHLTALGKKALLGKISSKQDALDLIDPKISCCLTFFQLSVPVFRDREGNTQKCPLRESECALHLSSGNLSLANLTDSSKTHKTANQNYWPCESWFSTPTAQHFIESIDAHYPDGFSRGGEYVEDK